MAANRRKQDDKNLEILRELISLNGNKYCLDCNQRGPTYVNTTIGSFVCSKCSGMLRGLTPPHRVKSISMATFTPEEIEFIKARGNDYCRRVWLGLYEGESVNFTDEQSVKDFMSDKYEKKRYYLDTPMSSNASMNGNSTKNKLKVRAGSNAVPTPLISISQPPSKNTVNNNSLVQTAKVVNNLLPANDVSHRIVQPVSSLAQPLLNTVNVAPVVSAVPAPVPDFPVDFTTANIYNSSQFNSNMNNNFTSPSMTTQSFNAFGPPAPPANDRYAALADLDLALRQQNMKHMEENNIVNNKNPFQSTATNDMFGNKNPFFNGGWSTTTAPVPVNPFMEDVKTYIQSIATESKCKLTTLRKILEHKIIKENVLKVTKLLEKSVEIRLNRQPNKCKECLNIETNHCQHCTVGVLFSGGLDCTILALLADKYLPLDQSIDLINVAFNKDDNASYDVPDRLTGRQSFLELQALCPTRRWVFIEVNVSKEELDKYQESTIGDLVYPRKTILDESLGTALWFAARGQDGPKTSTCRVLLVGSGADELFGGYIRHRNAFKRNGWRGLSKELQLDWNRISFRNLARDNRVICDHGRQPRMPYLDENFTKYVLELKPWLRSFPSEDMGIGLGDKLMLRLVAINLGLIEAVVLPKRALQFGSRIANKKEKGSDVSKTFLKYKIIPSYKCILIY